MAKLLEGNNGEIHYRANTIGRFASVVIEDKDDNVIVVLDEDQIISVKNFLDKVIQEYKLEGNPNEKDSKD